MDTLQLNKINELAREYLRLGIAKGSSDAVEKARFQLAFEAQKAEPEKSPYEALFNERMKQQAERAEQQRSSHEPSRSQPVRQERPELSPLDLRKDRFEEFAAKLESIETTYERAMRTQQSRIAQLEQTLESMRSEIAHVKAQRLVAAQAPAPTREPESRDGPIASTIEQTIKGRTITSDDVAVDKIFYFGNR